MSVRIEERLERIGEQIARLESEMKTERPWSDKAMRLKATKKRLQDEAKMLQEKLNEGNRMNPTRPGGIGTRGGE